MFVCDVTRLAYILSGKLHNWRCNCCGFTDSQKTQEPDPLNWINAERFSHATSYYHEKPSKQVAPVESVCLYTALRGCLKNPTLIIMQQANHLFDVANNCAYIKRKKTTKEACDASQQQRIMSCCDWWTCISTFPPPLNVSDTYTLSDAWKHAEEGIYCVVHYCMTLGVVSRKQRHLLMWFAWWQRRNKSVAWLSRHAKKWNQNLRWICCG